MLTLPPAKGEISLAGVFPFAGVGGSSRTRIIVVVVLVVVVAVVVVVVVVSLLPCIFSSTRLGGMRGATE